MTCMQTNYLSTLRITIEKKDGITIFKILIERCGSNSTNGFLKDPQLRKVLFEDIIGVFNQKNFINDETYLLDD